MLTTLAFGVGVLTTTAMLPMVTRAELQVLTPSQLDLVTAAGVYVDTAAFAGALGPHASLGADTRTHVVSTGWLEAALGIGVGRALVCCGDASEAYVGSVAAAGGERVRGGSFSLHLDNGIVAHGIASDWVLALSSPTAQDFARVGQVLVTGMQQPMPGSPAP